MAVQVGASCARTSRTDAMMLESGDSDEQLLDDGSSLSCVVAYVRIARMDVGQRVAELVANQAP